MSTTTTPGYEGLNYVVNIWNTAENVTFNINQTGKPSDLDPPNKPK